MTREAPEARRKARTVEPARGSGNGLGRLIGRLLIVPLGLLAAGVAAFYVLFTLGLERITRAMHAQGSDAEGIMLLLGMLRDGFKMSSGLTIVPVVLVVLIGEIARIRTSIYYILGGGAALAAIPLVGSGGVPATPLWQVFATAGFAGGLVYWMLAGRRA